MNAWTLDNGGKDRKQDRPFDGSQPPQLKKAEASQTRYMLSESGGGVTSDAQVPHTGRISKCLLVLYFTSKTAILKAVASCET